jgi:hypothetical protein
MRPKIRSSAGIYTPVTNETRTGLELSKRVLGDATWSQNLRGAASANLPY